jgi:hypothetical protein
MTAWTDYLTRLVGSSSSTVISKAVGVSQPTVHRWFKGSVPKSDSVLTVIRALDLDPCEAMIEAGDWTDIERRALRRIRRQHDQRKSTRVQPTAATPRDIEPNAE